MNDPSPLESELTDQLRSRAGNANPPADAWERFGQTRTLQGAQSSDGLFDGDVFADLVVPIQIEADRGSHDVNGPTGNRFNLSRLSVAGVAAALVVAVVGIGLLITGDGDEQDRRSNDVAAVSSAESELDVMEDYFAAYDAGAIDLLMALFASDATFNDSFFGNQTAEEFVAYRTWEFASQTDHLDVECGPGPGAGAGAGAGGIVCRYGDRSYVSSAVGGPVVPIR